MAENFFQILCVKMRRNPKHALTIKTSVCCEYMKMRIEPQKITERLDGDDGAGDCILLWDNGLEKHFQRVPRTSAQIGEEFAVIEEISAEDFGYTEDEMPVRNGLEDLFAEPFPEFNNPLLMA